MTTPLPPIIYEDDALIASDKPSGLLAAPDRWDSKIENLMTMVHERVSPTWFNLHRLDRDASGVMLLAKTREALRTLTRTWSNGTGEALRGVGPAGDVEEHHEHERGARQRFLELHGRECNSAFL